MKFGDLVRFTQDRDIKTDPLKQPLSATVATSKVPRTPPRVNSKKYGATRDRVIELVNDNPGMTAKAIAHKLGRKDIVLTHYVRRGTVKARELGYYPMNYKFSDEAPAAPKPVVTEAKTTEVKLPFQVMKDLIDKNPGLTASELKALIPKQYEPKNAQSVLWQLVHGRNSKYATVAGKYYPLVEAELEFYKDGKPGRDLIGEVSTQIEESYVEPKEINLGERAAREELTGLTDFAIKLEQSMKDYVWLGLEPSESAALKTYLKWVKSGQPDS